MADIALTEKDVAWQVFRHKKDSLRLSASNIAALAGLHPFKILPELAANLVYQGSAGSLLLKQDATVLGMQLTSPEKVLEDLAAKAGASTKRALAEATRIKQGTKKVASIEEARKIKDLVMKTAAKEGNLSKKELATLQEGSRAAVDTGFGLAHEEEALNLLEAQTKSAVGQRNADVLEWHFICNAIDGVDTVVPTGPAKCRPPYRRRLVRIEDGEGQVGAADSSVENQSETSPNEESEVEVIDVDDAPVMDTATPIEASDSTGQEKSGEQVKLNVESAELPFFSILGSVDGIREEIISLGETDDDSWVLESIVVEVKHRMRKVHPVPPLYEQVQAVAYALMYNLKSAEIVQVLRVKEASSRPKKVPKESENQKNTLDPWLGLLKPDDGGNNGSTKQQDDNEGAESSTSSIGITVSKVKLDDPIMNHRTNWTNHVLPRLRSFVEAVYRIREDDHKRYRLLVSVSESPDSATADGWELLHDECPWLKNCDTAFRNLSKEG
jgi:hypothetical protein